MSTGSPLPRRLSIRCSSKYVVVAGTPELTSAAFAVVPPMSNEIVVEAGRHAERRCADDARGGARLEGAHRSFGDLLE